jgi:CRISPR-associated endonuclease Csn1
MANSFLANLKTEKILPKEDKIAVVIKQFTLLKKADGFLQRYSIIDKTLNELLGWKFLFTMKQNEMFIFPSGDFNPFEIDLLDNANYNLISPHLFRVQKIATKNYMFRHHLETKVDDIKELKNTTYINLRNTEALRGIIKTRINNLGNIVYIGEY